MSSRPFPIFRGGGRFMAASVSSVYDLLIGGNSGIPAGVHVFSDSFDRKHHLPSPSLTQHLKEVDAGHAPFPILQVIGMAASLPDSM